MAKKLLLIIDTQKAFNTNCFTQLAANRIEYVMNLHNHFIYALSQFENDIYSPWCDLLDYHSCWKGEEDSQCCLDIATEEIDYIYTKSTYSAATTHLTQIIKSEKIDEVYLAGFGTESAILATAFGLFDMGIQPYILSDCCASYDEGALNTHLSAIEVARSCFGAHSIVTVDQFLSRRPK